MATFLLTWNPSKYPWDDLPDLAARCRAEGRVAQRWSCGNTRKIEPGDRIYLLRQGVEPRGIVGTGVATSAPFEAEDWAEGGGSALYVDVDFESLLDPGRDDVFARERLDDEALAEMHWDSQSSGVSIPDAVTAPLATAWTEHLLRIGYRGASGPAAKLDPAGLEALRSAFLEYNDEFATFPATDTRYHREERVYKAELVERFREQLGPERFDELESDDRVQAVLDGVRAVVSAGLPNSGKPQNLLSWRYTDFVRKMTMEDTRLFARALGGLLYGEGDSPERLESFNKSVWPIMKRHDARGQAASRSLPTFFLMLADPAREIYIRSDNFGSLYRLLLGRNALRATIFDAAQYGRARQLAGRIFGVLEAWGWQPHDMIDVQGFIYVAVSVLEDKNRRPTLETTVNEAPAVPASATSAGLQPASFGALLDQLAADGLYFPVELVANYLLALQAKRFAILTGISGTGKTRLARAVARHYRPEVQVAVTREAPENAVEKRVFPSSLKYAGIAIPVALARQLQLPPIDPKTNGGTITMRYPEGQQELTFWKDPSRNVTSLSFRGAFRSWFHGTFEVNDRFLLAIEPSAQEGEPDALRISLPHLVSETRPLNNYEVVAVRPDWTDNRNLVGFYSQLTREYHRTPFLDLLLRARAEADAAAEAGRDPWPFFVVLDEMNLARVEHYFSDFLSCLESGEPLQLHAEQLLDPDEEDDAADVPEIPKRLAIPPNLFITGTVNIDETTYMFSPKVLDRAFTLELNEVDLSALDDPTTARRGEAGTPLFLHRLPGMPEQLPITPAAADALTPADEWGRFAALLDGDLRDALSDLHALLVPGNRHFGYRVAVEIARFVNLAAAQAGEDTETLWAALDLAILQKVLPKFHGTQQQLEAVLSELFAFAINGSSSGDATGHADWRWDLGAGIERIGMAGESATDEIAQLPRTAVKLWRMLNQLQRQGFTAYIE